MLEREKVLVFLGCFCEKNMSKYFDRKSHQGVKSLRVDQKKHNFNYISCFRVLNLFLESFDVRTPKRTPSLGCCREKVR